MKSVFMALVLKDVKNFECFSIEDGTSLSTVVVRGLYPFAIVLKAIVLLEKHLLSLTLDRQFAYRLSFRSINAQLRPTRRWMTCPPSA